MSDAGESQHSPADSEAATLGNVASSPISSSQTKRYKILTGRGRSNMAGESFEEGADQSFFLDDEGTSVIAEMLAQLRKAYDIPSSVILSLPRPGFRPSRPGSNEEVLGVEPTIEDVHAIFALTTTLKELGHYYLRTYTGQPHLVPQVNPNTADKAWDDFWFVVSGDWGQTVVKDGETYIVPNQFKWAGKWTRDLSRDTDIKSVREYVVTNPSETDIFTEECLAKAGLILPPFSGALGSEVPTPSSVTRRMAEGSKTNLAFLQLVRDRMAKAAGTPILEFTDSEKGSEVAGLNPNQAIDMASHLFLQFDDKLKEGSTSAGHVAKLEAQLSRLTQKVKDKDNQISKLEDQLGEVRDEVGSVKTRLQAQVDKANELQASVDKLETEAGSNLFHEYHYAQYQVTREYSDLDLHYLDFEFDRDALVAKFGKDQNPADVAGSSQQLTSWHPLNLEVSPPHSDQEEDDSEDQDDKGSQSRKGNDA
ncbi:hypothetical protein OWV82_016450 [Melia azedarach]|uniref:Uncharacterized protein n=1 Tax=Melia azedarach TaxID=155640 RepID=A0ACC1XFJ6_MELAZ|nr:hypothetical protein OWV82_016450 [Melia azedarach]